MAQPDTRALYESLVRQHASDLYRFAFRFVGDTTKAEDLVQETYFHAWRSIGSLREPEAGRAWLMTILRRRWVRGIRREAHGPQVRTGGTDIDDTASPLPGPDLNLFALRESIQAALDRLDLRFKEPFLLVFMEGLSCREAAERLSIPLGTVLSRIHRARGSLRELLREEGAATRRATEDPQRSSGRPS